MIGTVQRLNKVNKLDSIFFFIQTHGINLGGIYGKRKIDSKIGRF